MWITDCEVKGEAIELIACTRTWLDILIGDGHVTDVINMDTVRILDELLIDDEIIESVVTDHTRSEFNLEI